MEAKLKLKLNDKESKSLLGVLGEQGGGTAAVQKESVPGVESIVRKFKSAMPKVQKGK